MDNEEQDFYGSDHCGCCAYESQEADSEECEECSIDKEEWLNG